jgi:hypothetical protein
LYFQMFEQPSPARVFFASIETGALQELLLMQALSLKTSEPRHDRRQTIVKREA